METFTKEESMRMEAVRIAAGCTKPGLGEIATTGEQIISVAARLYEFMREAKNG